jgi:hypothetical protein
MMHGPQQHESTQERESTLFLVISSFATRHTNTLVKLRAPAMYTSSTATSSSATSLKPDGRKRKSEEEESKSEEEESKSEGEESKSEGAPPKKKIPTEGKVSGVGLLLPGATLESMCGDQWTIDTTERQGHCYFLDGRVSEVTLVGYIASSYPPGSKPYVEAAVQAVMYGDAVPRKPEVQPPNGITVTNPVNGNPLGQVVRFVASRAFMDAHKELVVTGVVDTTDGGEPRDAEARFHHSCLAAFVHSYVAQDDTKEFLVMIDVARMVAAGMTK